MEILGFMNYQGEIYGVVKKSVGCCKVGFKWFAFVEYEGFDAKIPESSQYLEAFQREEYSYIIKICNEIWGNDE